ncbi:hypothetical protein B0H11DRAFT_433964 [Mycena galericulata]|nr:hypothetical protein B0H11DRAFT_433964 [Mycena galericulata]
MLHHRILYWPSSFLNLIATSSILLGYPEFPVAWRCSTRLLNYEHYTGQLKAHTFPSSYPCYATGDYNKLHSI